MPKAVSDIVKITEKDARKLLAALGVKRTNMDIHKLEERMKILASYHGHADQLEGPELRTYKRATSAIAEGMVVAVVPNDTDTEEEEEAPTTPLDEEESNALDLENEEEPKAEDYKKPAGRVPATNDNPPFREVAVPKFYKATKTLAAQFQALTGVPGDRGVKAKRKNVLMEAMRRGEFRGNEWCRVKCLENNTVYRVNGNTSSSALLALLNDDKQPEFPEFKVVVREYEADTLEGVARLYSTFDPAGSSRSKVEQIKAYAAGVDVMREFSSKSLSIITAGIAFAKEETAYRRLSAAVQGEMLVHNTQFAEWVNELLPSKKRGRNKADSEEKNIDHMRRVPVIAAMYRTWQSDLPDATEFWTMVRDDCDLPKDSGVRKLFRFLKDHGIGAAGKDSSAKVADREMYIKCLLAWNSWRNGEETVRLQYHKDAPTPEVA